MNSFVIKNQYTKFIKRFQTRATVIDFKIKDIPKKEDPEKWVIESLKDIIKYATATLLPQDKVGISFCDTEFVERGPGYLSFRNFSQFNVFDVLNMISSIFQSNTEGLSTDTFCLSVTTVRMPTGTGELIFYFKTIF